MNHDLVPIEKNPTDFNLFKARPIVDAWLEGRSPTTVKAYAGDITHFGRWWMPVLLPAQAIDLLLSKSSGEANEIALAYRGAMDARGLATATIARRLAALRSVVKLARTLGRVTWSIEIPAHAVEGRNDVRGPDEAGWQAVWKVAVGAGDGPAARRNRAIISVLYDLGLRRSEAAGLTLASVDLVAGKVSVKRKGKREALRLTLPEPTTRALREWIEVRGWAPGPLFVRKNRGVKGHQGLGAHGIWSLVRALGVRAGLPRPLRPHGLRHAACTKLMVKGRSTREGMKFSGHAKEESFRHYDDDARDVFGAMARIVAGKRSFGKAPNK